MDFYSYPPAHLIDFFATKAERHEEKLYTDEHRFTLFFLISGG
jgi:hypothetical protein